ncbi:MAG: hypothetical protein GXP15_02135 [Gammaproteobacteria bacterium]|nr:hypothetical protein [Gammaproteobacteria bacterium]
MLKWLKKQFSSVTQEDEFEVEFASDADESEEDFAPVGVRVRPTEAAELKPADTYVAGYNVSEGEVSLDDEFSTTVNNIKTTGVDPYNAGGNE